MPECFFVGGNFLVGGQNVSRILLLLKSLRFRRKMHHPKLCLALPLGMNGSTKNIMSTSTSNDDMNKPIIYIINLQGCKGGRVKVWKDGEVKLRGLVLRTKGKLYCYYYTTTTNSTTATTTATKILVIKGS